MLVGKSIAPLKKFGIPQNFDRLRLATFFLPANDPSCTDNLSYIEHIFEISRRPDLLTRVVEYRTTVLKISEDDEIDTKLTRIPSAKKYKGTAKGWLVRSSALAHKAKFEKEAWWFVALILVFLLQALGLTHRRSFLRGNLA